MGLIRMWQNRNRVLGRNERNLSYIKAFNSPKAKRIADDKLLTKKVLTKANIPTPGLIGHIDSFAQLYEFNWDLLPNSFVIKPVHGLEGGGIEIFFNRDKNGNWIKADGSRYSLSDIQNLAADIIDGKYSLHGQADQVFFEERVKMHKGFKYYAYKGVADIRILVFKGIPTMSYVRLPTKESNGKANLALGALAAGVDIATGVTTSGVSGKSKVIEYVPGTKLSVSGLKIPYWDKMLRYSIEAQKLSGMGFAGIDFLIDRDKGPMIVELNARPGLSIQIANNDGLKWRLLKAKGLKVSSVEKGMRLAKDLFGGEIEGDIERISGKSVIGIYEDVFLYPLDEKAKEIQTKAKIDTGADSTSIDTNLAIKLGYKQYLDDFEQIKRELNVPEEIETVEEANDITSRINQILETRNYPIKTVCWSIISSHGRSLRLSVEIDIKLGDFRYTTMANTFDRSKLTYKVIIGRKSLNRFLVEPSKTKIELETPKSQVN